jgi:integrase
VRFGEYALVWIDVQRDLAVAGLIRANTLTRLESALAAHLMPFFAGYALAEVDRSRCEAFRTTLFRVGNLAPRTINGLVAILRMILHRARLDGLLAGPNPLDRIRPLWVTPRRIDCYTPDEVTRLISAVPSKWKIVVALAALAGLRQGEIYALRRCDLDIDAGWIQVRQSLQRSHRLLTLDQRFAAPKSPAALRDVPIRAPLNAHLRGHLARHWTPNERDLLICGRGGHPVYAVNFRRRVYLPAIAHAGLRPLSLHDLRATFITHCAEAGVPIAIIARWAGHAQTKVTEMYYHTTGHGVQTAISLLDRYDDETTAS